MIAHDHLYMLGDLRLSVAHDVLHHGRTRRTGGATMAHPDFAHRPLANRAPDHDRPGGMDAATTCAGHLRAIVASTHHHPAATGDTTIPHQHAHAHDRREAMDVVITHAGHLHATITTAHHRLGAAGGPNMPHRPDVTRARAHDHLRPGDVILLRHPLATRAHDHDRREAMDAMITHAGHLHTTVTSAHHHLGAAGDASIPRRPLTTRDHDRP